VSDLACANTGAILCQLERKEKALQVLDQALRLDSTLAAAHANRGKVLFLLRKEQGGFSGP